MSNTPYPYLQGSSNQLLDTLQIFVNVYTNVAILLGALLLVLLVWLCVSELRQSPPRFSASRKLKANHSQPRSDRQQASGRALLE